MDTSLHYLPNAILHMIWTLKIRNWVPKDVVILEIWTLESTWTNCTTIQLTNAPCVSCDWLIDTWREQSVKNRQSAIYLQNSEFLLI